MSAPTRARTADLPVRPVEPRELVLPLKPEFGPDCLPCVGAGERVRRGQLVAKTPDGARAEMRLHAPRAGVVTRLARAPLPDGGCCDALVLHVEGHDAPDDASGYPDVERDPAAILDAARIAGIVGMGGAGFPLYLKLMVPPGSIDTVILNGCESEPYLTSDHRVLLERSDAVVEGLRLLRRAVGAERGVVALTRERAEHAASVLARRAPEWMDVVLVEDRAALGYEKALIRAVRERVVPAGGLPRDVGVSVHNVQTAVALADAVHRGEPLIERVLTVAGGAVAQPGNLRVPVGMTVRAVLVACGFQEEACEAVVVGGPMMGLAIAELDVPVRKATSGLLALTAGEVRRPPASPCIRCGTCISVCPVGLEPVTVERCGAATPAELAALGVDLCVACGECEAACPAGRHLLDVMRAARARVTAARGRSA